MKGLTDAEFERLYGIGDPCLAALVMSRQLQEPAKISSMAAVLAARDATFARRSSQAR
jgi:hypothetical protein